MHPISNKLYLIHKDLENKMDKFTWKIRSYSIAINYKRKYFASENWSFLSKVIYPKFYKNTNESCALFGQGGYDNRLEKYNQLYTVVRPALWVNSQCLWCLGFITLP